MNVTIVNKRMTGGDLNDRVACHSHGLPTGAKLVAVAPAIAEYFADRFQLTGEVLSDEEWDLSHWLVSQSNPRKVTTTFSWEALENVRRGEAQS